ncbi:MAG: HAD hydrolase-like protein [Clostridia bacterium]
MKQLLWDWNGTLLDDLRYAINVRNRVFPLFGLNAIQSVEAYHAQFTFPVRVYYERAGVTEQNFDAVAQAWMDEYVRNYAEIPLHNDALATLARLRAAGLRQVVLSASHLEVLCRQIAFYPLEGFFQQVLGLGDIYARSKEAVGRQYLTNCGIAPAQTVMVGDTLHDADVARALGVHCVLVARGHQSRAMLLQAGVPVVSTLTEAADWVLNDK